MSALSSINRDAVTRVLGIDASTKAIAFCLYVDGEPSQWGIFKVNGADIFERIRDASRKTSDLLSAFSPDYVAIEAAVFVNSQGVAIKLAYVYGGVMAALLEDGTKVVTVLPQQWQNYIGNKNLTKAEKDLIKTTTPGKSASWYYNTGREFRKGRTMGFFNDKYGTRITDDNVSDSFGLAYYAVNNLTRPNAVQE